MTFEKNNGKTKSMKRDEAMLIVGAAFSFLQTALKFPKRD